MPNFINDDKIYISIKPQWGSYRVLQAPEGTPEIVFLNWDTEQAKESHLVSEKDSERIKCLCCGDKAYICLHDEWDTGNRKGVSFFYFCKAHQKGMWHGKPIPL